jgi:two-component system response regulator YesN
VLAIVEELFGARSQERCLFMADSRRVIGVVQSAFLAESRLLEVSRNVIATAAANLKLSLSIGIGGVSARAADLGRSYAQALEALKLKSGRGRSLVHIHSGEAASTERKALPGLRSALGRITDCMKAGDADGVGGAVEGAFQAFRQDGSSFDEIRGGGERILAAATDLLEGLGFDHHQAEISRNPIETVATIEFLDDLKAYVAETCRKIALFLHGRMSPGYGTMVRKAIQYVREHFASSISLAEIARAVSASPWYFSRQFSKETGESFVNWLNRYRIERAEEIMRVEPDARIYEIAERVGFSDYKTFSANFKKYLGVPPRSYKQLPPDRQ